MELFVGIDVSKGYVDILTLYQGAPVCELVRYDDSRHGHRLFWRYLDDLSAQHPDLCIGLESTGGLERNWVRSLQRWSQMQPSVSTTVHVVDPRAVKRFAESLPGRCKTDPSSADAIARFLSVMTRARCREVRENDHSASFFRAVSSQQDQARAVINQIKSLLPQTHPSLVSYTSNSGLAQWVREVLKRYPTTACLARAHVRGLSRISHVTPERAQSLIAAARATPVSLDASFAEQHMRCLLQGLEHMEELLAQQWALLEQHFHGHTDYQRLQTITGLGSRNAAAFLAEIPDLRAFSSAKALVGFIGLDPVFEQSGDQVLQKGISHRGPAALRQMLYNAARSAAQHNPLIKRFHQRLMSNGKTYKQSIVACMAKLVRIAYACLVSETDFDPTYGQPEKEAQQAAAQRSKQVPLGRKELTASHDDRAPVSAQEKRRRRRAQNAINKKSSRGPTRSKSQKAGSPAAHPTMPPQEKAQA